MFGVKVTPKAAFGGMPAWADPLAMEVFVIPSAPTGCTQLPSLSQAHRQDGDRRTETAESQTHKASLAGATKCTRVD